MGRSQVTYYLEAKVHGKLEGSCEVTTSAGGLDTIGGGADEGLVGAKAFGVGDNTTSEVSIGYARDGASCTMEMFVRGRTRYVEGTLNSHGRAVGKAVEEEAVVEEVMVGEVVVEEVLVEEVVVEEVVVEEVMVEEVVVEEVVEVEVVEEEAVEEEAGVGAAAAVDEALRVVP